MLAVTAEGHFLTLGNAASAVILVVNSDLHRSIPAGKQHAGGLRTAIFVHMHQFSLLANRDIAQVLEQLRVRADGVAARRQRYGILRNRIAILSLVQHRHLRLDRCNIGIFEVEFNRIRLSVSMSIHRHLDRSISHRDIIRHLVTVGTHRVNTLLKGDCLAVKHRTVNMEIGHRYLSLGRGFDHILVQELHGRQAGTAIRIDGHFHAGSAFQLIAFHLAALRTNGICTRRQLDFLDIEQLAIDVIIVHRQHSFSRSRIFIGEEHADQIRIAVGIHSHRRGSLSHRHKPLHQRTVGGNGMGTGRQHELLIIDSFTVDVVVHHHHQRFWDRRRRGLLGGFRGRRGQLGICEDHFCRRSNTKLIHADFHGVHTDQLITLHIGGVCPNGRGLPSPAVDHLAVQHFASIRYIIQRHLHREGREFRFLTLMSIRRRGHVQIDGFRLAHANRCIIKRICISGIHTGCILRPDELGRRFAVVTHHVENMIRCTGHLHRQNLPQG